MSVLTMLPINDWKRSLCLLQVFHQCLDRTDFDAPFLSKLQASVPPKHPTTRLLGDSLWRLAIFN